MITAILLAGIVALGCVLIYTGHVVDRLVLRVHTLEKRLDGLAEPPPILAQPGYAMPMPGVQAMERNLNLPSGSLRCYCREDALDLADEIGGEPKIPDVDDQGHCSKCGWPRIPPVKT